MLDGENLATDDDALELPLRLASLEPKHRRLQDGKSIVVAQIGEMAFCAMPRGRASVWRSVPQTPRDAQAWDITIEVDSEEEPAIDHRACLVSIRRLHPYHLNECAQHINQRLTAMGMNRQVCLKDLTIVGVVLRPRPFIQGFTIICRDRTQAQMTMSVQFRDAHVQSVAIDEDISI